MQKVRRKQILQPIIKNQGLPKGPFPALKKGKSLPSAKKAKKLPDIGPHKPGWNLTMVGSGELVPFLDKLTQHDPKVCMLHIHLLPDVGGNVKVVYFYNTAA